MRPLKILTKLFSAKSRSSAGTNSSVVALILQSLPMYLVPSGWSLPPLSLLMIVNSRCNLKCRICDVGQKNRDSIFYRTMIGDSPQDMSLDAYRAIVGQISEKTFISITSTEPLLWKPLVDAVRWTVEGGREMNVTTNGLLLPDVAADLVAAGLHKLSVSLDGPEHIHNEIRGSPTSYERAVNGIRRIAECRDGTNKLHPRIIINTVLSPLNQGQMMRFLNGLPLDLIDRVNIELMTFCTAKVARLHNSLYGDRYPASETCLSGGINPGDMDIDLTLADMKNVMSGFGDKVTAQFPMNKEVLHAYFNRPETFLTNARCVFPYFTAQVNTRGDLMVMTRCYPISFGNVITDGFRAAWNSDKMKAFRTRIRKCERMPGCSRCEGVLYDL